MKSVTRSIKHSHNYLRLLEQILQKKYAFSFMASSVLVSVLLMGFLNEI